MTLRTSDKIIDATASALPVVAAVLDVARADRLEVFVESTPAAGESFNIIVEVRPRSDAAWRTVKSILVSQAQPTNSAEVSQIGTTVRLSVTAGGAEVAFTGKVWIVKVDRG